MPRARDIIVPDSVKGIDELVSRHTITRRGTVRTTETIVPVLRPPEEKKQSWSKRKGKQPQKRSDEGDRSGQVAPIIDDHPYIDEGQYYPQDVPEDSHPQATVCILFH